MNRYRSLYHMLSQVYPNYPWLPWKFTRFVSNDPEIMNKAIDYVEKELRISQPEDWYRVSTRQLLHLGIYSVFTNFGTLFDVLRRFRPHYSLRESQFSRVATSAPKLLGVLLRERFPAEEIVGEFNLSQSGDNPVTVSYYLPSFKVAFDYQNQKFYDSSEIMGQTGLKLIEDPLKVSRAKAKGIAIVFVPFWWDKTLESLIASTLSTRPELAQMLSQA
jgi:hypothetical protein